MPSAPHLYGNYLGDADYASLHADGAVGDIATTFFDGDGCSDSIRLNARSTGPDLEALRSVSRRICVVSGVHKIEALRAALAGAYITDLIIDEHTAHALLDPDRGACRSSGRAVCPKTERRSRRLPNEEEGLVHPATR